jgi:hypothetical protein
MDAIGTLGIALAGGSVGALLTLGAGVPEQVRHHNRQVQEFDDDLGQWVSDEMVRLEREIKRHRAESAEVRSIEADHPSPSGCHRRRACARWVGWHRCDA